jgi:predicted aminopeptidase
MLLGACSDGGYYLQAAKGQYDILKKRQPITELLASGKLSQQQQLELSRILEIRSFATEQLALPENDSYRSYVELETPYPIWNVVAAPELSLEAKTWCFPIAGCVSYRGYFSEADARAFAQSLQRENYDTLVAGVPAYSTLSWFDDPVLSSFSSWPAPSVARLIFHELAHQQLYLSDDSAFNEAFATSVELAGSKRWLAASGSAKEVELFQRQLEREEIFVEWTNTLHLRLVELYASSLSRATKRQQKQEILAEARHNYQSLKDSWGGYSGYDKWVASLNNARLTSLKTYRRLLPAFNALLAENNYDFKAFYLACKKLAEQPAEQRQRFLAKWQDAPKLATQTKH